MTRKIAIPVKEQAVPLEVETIKENNNWETNLKLIQKLFPDKLNFSMAEVATILNLSYDFVRKQINKRAIKAIKFGDRNMINVNELIRILTEGV